MININVNNLYYYFYLNRCADGYIYTISKDNEPSKFSLPYSAVTCDIQFRNLKLQKLSYEILKTEASKVVRSKMVKSKRQIRKGVWIKKGRQFG
jgi:hypothetical protein